MGVLGLTFKENVPDLRNSRVPDILQELTTFGIAAMVHDPLADRRCGHIGVRLELAPLDLMRSSTPWCWRCRIAPISSSASGGLSAMLGPRESWRTSARSWIRLVCPPA